MEKTPGKDIKEQYGVSAYPTFLFLNSDGTLRTKVVGGSRSPKGFINMCKNVMDPSRDITKLTKKYKSKKITKKELLIYREVLKENRNLELSEKVTAELFNKLTPREKVSKDFWPLIKEMGDMGLIERNIKYLRKNVGEKEVNKFVNSYYNNLLLNGIKGKVKNVNLSLVRKSLETLSLPNADNLFALLDVSEAQKTGDVNKYMDVISANKFKLDDTSLAMSVYSISRLVKEKDMDLYNKIVDFNNELVKDLSEETNKAIARYIHKPESRSYPGVWFEKKADFKQLLEWGKAFKHYLFIDCYTTWCGPCKYMATKILPQKECGEYFGGKFFCGKVDMEKEDGAEIKKRYGVNAYPTFLILNPDGTLLHKVVGGANTAADFIKRIDEAFDPNKALGSLKKKYEEGNTDKEFLINYAKALESAYDKAGAREVKAKLLSELTDAEKVSKDYWALFKSAPYGSDAYNYLIENKDAFVQSLGRETVESPLMAKATNKIVQVMGGRDKTSISELTKFVKSTKSLKLKDYKELSSLLKIATYLKADNISKLTKTASKVLPTMEATTNPFWTIVGQVIPKCDAKQKATWLSMGQKIVQGLPENLQKRGKQMLEKYK